WPHSLANIPASAWAGLLYVSFISQFFAFFVFNAAMAIGGVSRVGQLMLLQPFVIVALAAPVNGEPIQFVTLAYAAAVVATVIIGQRMRVERGRRASTAFYSALGLDAFGSERGGGGRRGEKLDQRLGRAHFLGILG